MKRLVKLVSIMTTVFMLSITALGFTTVNVSAQTKPIGEQEYAEIACTHADTGYYRDVVSTQTGSYHNPGAFAHTTSYRDDVYEGTVCAICGQKLTRTLVSTSYRDKLTSMTRYSDVSDPKCCQYCGILMSYKQPCQCPICGVENYYTILTNTAHNEGCPYFRK